MTVLNNLLSKRAEILAAQAQLVAERMELDHATVAYLIENDMPEFFSVDWNRVIRYLNKH